VTSVLSPCATCARFDRGQRGRNVCQAFPDEIPDDILWGDNDHTAPYAGDHGLQWIVAPDAPEAVRAANHPFPSRAA
jgi:hypothetical protein